MDSRPRRDMILMGTAHLWAQMSTCSRAHVGSVLALNGRIIATGYNGAPAGMPHCNHDCTCVDPATVGTFVRHPRTGNPLVADDPATWPHAKGCPAKTPCRVAVHAEANAIAFSAKFGVATAGAELFVTLSPCYVCSQLIINAGITRVVINELYRDVTGYELLQSAGIQVDRLP